MSEKKTFKNPVDMSVYRDGSIWVKDDNSTYNYDEWDMEVTFTKKVKPIQINSVVEDLVGNTGRVVAVQADKAWVHYHLTDVGRAADFDCVEWLSELTNVS